MKLLLFAFVVIIAEAGVSTSAQRHATHPISGSPLHLESEVKIPQSDPKTIREEMLDTNIVRMLAHSAGIMDNQLTNVEVVADGLVEGELWYNLLSSDGAGVYNRLGERLISYLHARLDGHTKECLLAALTNTVTLDRVSDPDLLTLLSNQTMLPYAWIKKEASVVGTNSTRAWFTETNVQYRQASFILIDGDVGWRYLLTYNPDGSFGNIGTTKFDAKEQDPKFAKAIQEAKHETEEEMKKRGDWGHFGSIRSFWRGVKEKLFAKGIQWRSPEELMPGTRFE
jgi:hypothetical protein